MIFAMAGRHWKLYLHKEMQVEIPIRNINIGNTRSWRKPSHGMQAAKLYPALHQLLLTKIIPANSNTPEVHQAKVTVCSDSYLILLITHYI